MKPSQKALDLIKKWEGCRLKAYRDIRGIWTCGYGCTGGSIGPGTIWSQEQADHALNERIDALGGILNSCVRGVLNQNQLDALVCLAYNIGITAFRGSSLLRAINERDEKKARELWLQWDHSAGQVVPGLLARRKEEWELFSKAS